MLGLQLLRGGLGVVATLLLGQALAFSFDGEPTAVLTYAIFYGAAGLFTAGVVGLSLEIHRRKVGRSEALESPTVHHALDGGSELRVGLRPGQPQIVILEVGLTNPNPSNIEGVSVNILIPEEIRGDRCGLLGEPTDEGSWLDTPERLPDEPEPGTHKDYWASGGITLPGGGTKLLTFKLRLAAAGTYYLATELFGGVPKQRTYAKLVVAEAAEGHPRELIGEAIHAGESLLATEPDEVTQDQAVVAWVIGSWWPLPQECIPLWNAAAGPALSDARQQARAKLEALYKCRRRLAGSGGTTP